MQSRWKCARRRWGCWSRPEGARPTTVLRPSLKDIAQPFLSLRVPLISFPMKELRALLITLISSASTDLSLRNEIFLFPNPARDRIGIRRYGQSLPERLQLYNTTGQWLQSIALEAKVTAVDAWALPAGCIGCARRPAWRCQLRLCNKEPYRPTTTRL